MVRKWAYTIPNTRKGAQADEWRSIWTRACASLIPSTRQRANGHTAVKLTLQELEAAAGAEGWVDVCKEPEGE